MSTAIVWFRQDLRLYDNPALTYASEHHDNIIPIYIFDENVKPSLGAAQRWWLHHSLNNLSDSFHKHHAELFLLRGDSDNILETLSKQHDVEAVYWNRCYEPDSLRRDAKIARHLKSKNIDVESFNASLLVEPWDIENKQGNHFKVFTPFWKTLKSQFHPRELLPIPKMKQKIKIESDNLDNWSLLPTHPDWSKGLSQTWQIGEAAAIKQLETFIDTHLDDYDTDRDRPAVLGTSRLSPHLHFGEISPLQIWYAVSDTLSTHPNWNQSSERYLTELGWREFSYHLLYHFPKLPSQNFNSKFDRFPWKQSKKMLRAWQHGETGFPIVDAGMRELWETGYMHNRVRMIVASFLTKDLLIDWRKGEDWFWDTLVDADLANNAMGWQWVAGSGADAAPYFRVFNPVLQGEKFDKSGEYVRRWVPELASLPDKYIHQPWNAPEDFLQTIDYPEPIVDHKAARDRALAIYKKL